MIVSFDIDEKDYKRFNTVLTLRGESQSEILKCLINGYAKSVLIGEINAIDNDGSIVTPEQMEDKNYAKAIKKMFRWAARKDGIPHKIIKAYLLSEKDGVADLYEMRKLCTDKNRPDLYVGDEKKFDMNFSQLKYDSARSHGHVFNAWGEEITVWDKVDCTLRKYADKFLEK